MLHTRFKAESPVLKVGSCHGTQLKVTGLSALPRKPNLDKLAALLRPSLPERSALRFSFAAPPRTFVILRRSEGSPKNLNVGICDDCSFRAATLAEASPPSCYTTQRNERKTLQRGARGPAAHHVHLQTSRSPGRRTPTRLARGRSFP